MKAAHRRNHRRIWWALAILLPLGLAVGLGLKQPVPISETTFDVPATSGTGTAK